VQGAEAAAQFGGAQATFAEEPAEKIFGAANLFL
jgi:hypothetical protein